MDKKYCNNQQKKKVHDIIYIEIPLLNYYNTTNKIVKF